MVSEVTSADSNNDPASYRVDSVSSSSSEDLSYDGRIVLREGEEGPAEPPSFGNISVMNSNDVHFGNKTFYQGPVTIKQFLYANGKVPSLEDGESKTGEVVLDAAELQQQHNGLDNPCFVADVIKNKLNGAPTVGKCAAVQNDDSPQNFFKGLRHIQRKNVYILGSLLAILVIFLVILTAVLVTRNAEAAGKTGGGVQKGDSDEQDITKPVDAPLDPSVNLTLPGKLKLVSRIEWLAQPPVAAATPLNTPVPYVIISHTATENCSSQAQCVFHVRYIQTFHIESRQWWDIGYNFLVGGDGEAYEGRGWKAEGAHTYGYNSKSIGIAFIGTFNSFRPPQRQITACKQLIQKGVELGYIRKDYKLLAARQLQTTQSPGAVLYEDIKTWDHWATKP